MSNEATKEFDWSSVGFGMFITTLFVALGLLLGALLFAPHGDQSCEVTLPPNAVATALILARTPSDSAVVRLAMRPTCRVGS